MNAVLAKKAACSTKHGWSKRRSIHVATTLRSRGVTIVVKSFEKRLSVYECSTINGENP